MIDIDGLHSIMTFAPRTRLELFVDPLNAAMREFEINTTSRETMFLATLAHESGEFRYMEELADGSVYDGREDLGNTKPEAIAVATTHGSTPGRWWKGHGPIQVTGYNNHLACGIALGIDLVNEPQLIAQPGPGCRSAGWFWRNAKLRDGTTVDLNAVAELGDFRQSQLVVNRGLMQSEHDPLGWAQRQAYYTRARSLYAERADQED